MTSSVIVEGLGKRYRIAQSGRESYSTLRDTIARNLRRGGRASATGARELVDFWALRDISFEVAKGDVVGIVEIGRAHV